MKKLLALLGVVTLTTNVVVAGVSIANADKKKQNDIIILQSKLQAILSSKTDARWEVSELQKKVDKEFGEGEITVSFKDYTKVTSIAKAEFIFKANNKKYTGQLTLTQTYTIKENIAEDISLIKEELENLVKTKTHTQWDQTDLQNQINTKYGEAEITVTVGAYSDVTDNVGGNKKQAKITFKGNGTSEPDNKLKYQGKLDINHNYTEQTTIDQNQLKDVKTTLEKAQFVSKEQAISGIKLAYEYKPETKNRTGTTGIKGVQTANVEYKKSEKGDKSSFTVSLVLSEGYVLPEGQGATFEVIVGLNSRIDIKSDVNIQNDIKSIINDENHKEKAWDLKELQSALDSKFGQGELSVKEKTSEASTPKETFNSELGAKSEDFTITGLGNSTNDKKYENSLDVTHEYKIYGDLSSDTAIQNKISAIVNETNIDDNKPHAEKAWTQAELQKAIDAEFGASQISVSKDELKEKETTVNNEDEWIFKPADENSNYKGEYSVKHSWINYVVSVNDVQTALNGAVKEGMTSDEAIKELKLVVIPGVKSIEATEHIDQTKGFAKVKFDVTVTLKENRIWNDNKFTGVFIVTGSKIGKKDKVTDTSINEELAKLGTSYVSETTAKAAIEAAVKNVAGVTGITDWTLSDTSSFAIETKTATFKVSIDGDHTFDGTNQFSLKLSIGEKDKVDVTNLVAAITALEGQKFADKAALQTKVNDLVGETPVTATVNDVNTGQRSFTDTKYTVSLEAKASDTELVGYDTPIELTVRIGQNDKVDVTELVAAITALEGQKFADKTALQTKVNDLVGQTPVTATVNDANTEQRSYTDTKYTVSLVAKNADTDLVGYQTPIELTVLIGSVDQISTVLQNNTVINNVEDKSPEKVLSAVEAQVQELTGHIEIADIAEVQPGTGTYADVTRNYTATVKAKANDKDYTGSVSIKFSVTANETKEVSSVLPANTVINNVEDKSPEKFYLLLKHKFKS
ncbi:hypothetical protein CG001_02320 [Mesoplasma coleopterae]|uniref:hypothetical protein n=1 Tax=Mesoplasma coleopterae TaxID=324078 RepID=UPI000D044642|nr:hypothetical protein [Mesoplasma coleopterae]AVN62463.1 hypothetical protein CG001_02320 [Mesoplasma coleopterae]